LSAAVVFSLCFCNFAGSAKAGFFSDAGSRLFGRGSTRMAVGPIVGAPPNITEQLTQSLVDAGKDRKLTLTPGSGGAPFNLRGYLVATREKKGSKISYIWDVSDANGKRVARVSGEEVISSRPGGDPWEGVDSAALRSLAAKITAQLADSMSGGRGADVATTSPDPGRSAPPAKPPAAAPVPDAPREVMALVAPVSGAPGDGQKSLTAALKKRLFAGGVKLASAASRNVYTVKGSVSMAEASGGKQSIRIDWQVLDPNGKKLGTVSQQNMIPKGSLDGPWGAIADAAAGAAADGIIKLLPRSST
jgi:hypothetical protein